MTTLAVLLRRHSELSPADVAWLHRLIADWQTIADLSYSDLLLWAPSPDGFVVVGLCRPATAATEFVTDPVGTLVTAVERPDLALAFAGTASTARIDPENLHTVGQGTGRMVEATPVVRAGRVVAVLSKRFRTGLGKLSPLERAYRRTADELVTMVREGAYPDASAPTGGRRGAPRVGDGLIRLDADGMVTYASPNALSSFHRLGYLGGMQGELLAEIATDLVDAPGLVDEVLPLVVTGRAAMRTQLLSHHDVAVSLRSIPVILGGQREAAVVLCRDVTEVYRGEQELLTKDATIREIHHRVKNNLQTVSALLRMQARRIESKKGRAALEEAMRRVGTIALVHETLSLGLDETLDLDALLTKVLGLVRPLVWSGDEAGEIRQLGHGGQVAAKEANALALVVMELVANALEHAGRPDVTPVVTVAVERTGKHLRVTVEDNGPGMPERFAPGNGGLGTQIVHALVTGELGGWITWADAPTSGTVVTVECEAPGDNPPQRV